MGKQRASWATSEAIRKTMQGCRHRDTKPELALRSAVHRLGLRYRTAVRPVPSLARTADLVFSRVKLAVFLDGCFWHGCPEHSSLPQAHSSYWEPKLRRNKERDAETNAALRAAGWTVLRIWEHEDPAVAAETVKSLYSTLMSARREEQDSGRRRRLSG